MVVGGYGDRVAVALATLLVYPLREVAPAVSLGVVYIPGVPFIPPTGRFDVAADLAASLGPRSAGRRAGRSGAAPIATRSPVWLEGESFDRVVVPPGEVLILRPAADDEKTLASAIDRRQE